MKRQYKKVGIGGTFDRLHAGHKKLLERAFSLSEFVLIGVTADSFVSQKELSNLIYRYPDRVNQLRYYLDSVGLSDRYDTVMIKDLYGPAVESTDLEALVVSTETLANAGEINKARAVKKLPKLAIEVIDLLGDVSNVPVSSTRIRQGYINTSGQVYAHVFSTSLRLTQDQLEALKMPLGRLVSISELDQLISSYIPPKIAVIGDLTLKTFIDAKVSFNYGVYDGKTHRDTQVLFTPPQYPAYTAENPPGTISHQAVDTIRRVVMEENSILKIEGEEDLLTLAFILFLPIQSLVFYGQPERGIVLVQVDEATKDQWYRFLLKADKITN